MPARQLLQEASAANEGILSGLGLLLILERTRGQVMNAHQVGSAAHMVGEGSIASPLILP